ncbi:extradiol ring-cleavage dioxygenase [Burkholderia diffusa]|uniref:DODA-type extradiol aromatic ring-opening family dioxygenase n=1 Tax=Burkholderia diffusa TaxID=488732 RepID=UPI002ABD1929|nr:extradiol ring-cleavage dioxygenase [Burkholderia diffusa]
MGKIVGAALVSHHPGLFQTDDFRIRMGDGADSDLIAGFERVRAQIEAVEADTIVIFDTHWFTTGFHLIDGGARYRGTYISDEMPWYLYGQQYDYLGSPEFARLAENVASERNIFSKGVFDETLPRHYATINIVNKLVRGEKVVTVSTCQNCQPHHYLESGAVIGETVARSDARVVLLASGALSHKFNEIDWVQKHPRIYHEENVSRPENIARDKEAIALFEAGRHDLILDQWDERFRPLPWEGFGGHYLQMIGALGGRACTSKGVVLSDYENARGTGNVHIWFPTT